jgi:uncharacterized protein (TIGR02996 family)
MTAADLDRAALLLAIVTDPADDAARLIFADWCEENGQPERAEFVRVQVELDRRGYAPGLTHAPTHRCVHCNALWVRHAHDESWSVCTPFCGTCCDNEAMGDQITPLPAGDAVILQRHDELIRLNMSRWLWESLPEDLLDGFGTWHHCSARVMSKRSVVRELLFTRGLISSVSLPLAAWLEHGPRLVRGHPITSVRASDRVPADAQEAGWSAAGVGWYRWQESEWRDPEDIPEHIWLHVPGEADAEAGRWKLFTDPAAAHAALGRALVAWARREAGLPPLPG